MCISRMPKTRKHRQRGGAPAAPQPHCQCTDPATGKGCTKLAANNSLFCEEHANCPMAPRNGFEPKFEPGKYNDDPAIYKSHNCYSYSMNVIDPKLVNMCRKNNNNDCRRNFHQPGALNGDRYALNAVDRRKCGVVEKLIMADVPEIEKSSFYGQCPAGKSKIALVVDEGEDYHFYRQDDDGWWSHKDGSNKVKRYDALKRRIFNPELASRDYRWQNSDLNYEDFCGFYCVPRDHAVVLGQGGARLAQTRAKPQQAGGFQELAGLSWRDRRSRRATRRRHRRS